MIGQGFSTFFLLREMNCREMNQRDSWRAGEREGKLGDFRCYEFVGIGIECIA